MLFLIPLLLLAPLALSVLIFFCQVLYSYVFAFYAQLRTGSILEPPVPFLTRISTGHGLLSLLIRMDRLDAARVINEWRMKHGDVFLIRGLFLEPNIIVTSETALKHVTVTNPFNYAKSRVTRNALSDIVGHDSVILSDGEPHSRRRRTLAPSMHHTALMSFAEIFLENGEQLAARLEQSKHTSGTDTDAFKHIHVSAFAIIVNACFGAHFVPETTMNQLQADYFRAILEPKSFALRRYMLQWVFSFLPFSWFAFELGLKRKLSRTMGELVDLKLSARRNASQGGEVDTSKRSSLIDIMVDAAEARRQVVDKDELVTIVMTLIAAGQGTSALGALWTIFELAMHPDWQARVRDEVSAWKTEDGLEALDKLPLLSRIAKESLRLHPPVHFSTRTAKGDDEIDGVKVCRGMHIRMHIVALQTAVDVWGDDALEFKPDRWLEEENEKKAFHYGTFLYGKHGCIGQRFALLEVKSFVAHVLRRMQVSAEQSNGAPTARGPFSTPDNMRLRFATLPLTKRA